MTDKYWDKPWSLVDGCTPCSPGCDHCWSAGMRHRFHHCLTRDGKVKHHLTNIYGRFNGSIETHPERLSIPLKRRQPTVYAIWNDFWHESVPDDFQYRALEIMSSHECRQHTFLILTKRPHIAASFFNSGHANDLLLDNVYHGLTVCNQQEADEKIPVFLQVTGKKFLSIEPMLGKMYIAKYIRHICGLCDKTIDRRECGPNFDCLTAMSPKRIDVVILGGETGPGARPMHPDWVRFVRGQCAAASVPFFFKSWGLWRPCADDHVDCKGHKSIAMCLSGKIVTDDDPYWKDKAFGGTDQGFWKAGSKRGGKRAVAGRLLDGQEYNDLPWRIGR